ncbi:MAG: hypothetical protein HXX81_03700 [Campylobacterales bacterium]|nr:hypothetical protein [Campylobacterales bacterium]
MTYSNADILSVVLEFSKKVSEIKDYTLLQEMLVDYSKRLTKAQRATVWFCDDLNKTLWSGVADGLCNENIPIYSGIVEVV